MVSGGVQLRRCWRQYNPTNGVNILDAWWLKLDAGNLNPEQHVQTSRPKSESFLRGASESDTVAAHKRARAQQANPDHTQLRPEAALQGNSLQPKRQLPMVRFCTSEAPSHAKPLCRHSDYLLFFCLGFVLEQWTSQKTSYNGRADSPRALPTTKKIQARTCVTPPITISIRPMVNNSMSHCRPIEMTCSFSKLCMTRSFQATICGPVTRFSMMTLTLPALKMRRMRRVPDEAILLHWQRLLLTCRTVDFLAVLSKNVARNPSRAIFVHLHPCDAAGGGSVQIAVGVVGLLAPGRAGRGGAATAPAFGTREAAIAAPSVEEVPRFVAKRCFVGVHFVEGPLIGLCIRDVTRSEFAKSQPNNACLQPLCSLAA